MITTTPPRKIDPIDRQAIREASALRRLVLLKAGDEQPADTRCRRITITIGRGVRRSGADEAYQRQRHERAR